MGDVGNYAADATIKSNVITRLFSQMSGAFVVFHIIKGKKDFRVEYLPDASGEQKESEFETAFPFSEIFPEQKPPAEIRKILNDLIDNGQSVHKVRKVRG